MTRDWLDLDTPMRDFDCDLHSMNHLEELEARLERAREKEPDQWITVQQRAPMPKRTDRSAEAA